LRPPGNGRDLVFGSAIQMPDWAGEFSHPRMQKSKFLFRHNPVHRNHNFLLAELKKAEKKDMSHAYEKYDFAEQSPVDLAKRTVMALRNESVPPLTRAKVFLFRLLFFATCSVHRVYSRYLLMSALKKISVFKN
jgi:hypothetical protein